MRRETLITGLTLVVNCVFFVLGAVAGDLPVTQTRDRVVVDSHAMLGMPPRIILAQLEGLPYHQGKYSSRMKRYSIILNNMQLGLQHETQLLNEITAGDVTPATIELAHRAYVYIRYAEHAYAVADRETGVNDPLLHLQAQKITIAWNLSRHAMDALKTAGDIKEGAHYQRKMEKARDSASQAIALLQELLLTVAP